MKQDEITAICVTKTATSMVDLGIAYDPLQTKGAQHRQKHQLKAIEMEFTGGNLWILQQSG